MIFIYISNYNYDYYKIYIDYLISNYDIELNLFENYKDLKNIYKININIFIDILNKNNIKKISLLDDNSYLLNINNLDYNNDYNYLKNYKINIINYNFFHNKILKNVNTIFLPILLDEKLIKKYNKIYDVALINIDDDYKNNIIINLKKKNILVNNINNCKKTDFYDILFKHKIFINFNENNLYDEIISSYCIYNKVIVINIKKDYDINSPICYKLNKYIIETSDDLLSNIILYILNNYNQIINNIYYNLNGRLLNENKIVNDSFFNNIDQNIIDDYGFIILRHVNSETTNKYWLECYNSIRKYYDNKIIIIDDNSDYNFISSDIELVNCTIIKSEYSQRGEILAYYYFYKFHYFKKAIILHDSTFINKYINFSNYQKIKYFWHFTHDWDNEEEELFLLNIFNNNELKNMYYDKTSWYGCYGLQTIIDYTFLTTLVNKYNLFNLLEYIKNRSTRMNLERIFSVICSNEHDELKVNPSIYGIIHHYIHWGYTFESYLIDKEENKLNNYDLIKVWTGR